MMFVVFLYGRPATGKFTIGKLVSKRLGVPLFHNHLTVDLVGTLFEFGTPEFIAMRERLWIDAFEASALAGRSFVFTFSPENTVAQSTIDKMKVAIEGSGGRILFVELTCDEDEIEDRISDQSRGQFGKLKDVELYRKLRSGGAFDSPVMPEPFLRIKTTTIDPQQSADIITEGLKNEGIEF